MSNQVTRLSDARPQAASSLLFLRDKTPLRSPFLPSTLSIESISRPAARPFHASSQSKQSTQQRGVKEEKTPDSEHKPESKENAGPEDQTKSEEEGKDSESKSEKKEKKEDLPPPPPHGDKTPWQVFMETMQTEFKQSKEWNESTKALASSANQIAESESVRKAREAYEATSGVVSQTAGKVVKTTAGAIGKGAQWTWETPVVKGVRKGANITGEVLDKATKPIRETEAFQNVKKVIDDGSSSRYGGWVEKEERRRRREELAKQNGGSQEILQEDPE